MFQKKSKKIQQDLLCNYIELHFLKKWNWIIENSFFTYIRSIFNLISSKNNGFFSKSSLEFEGTFVKKDRSTLWSLKKLIFVFIYQFLLVVV